MGANAAGVNTNFNEMGLTTGDFDNDGDLELYVTNIFQNGRYNRLFRNDSVSPRAVVVGHLGRSRCRRRRLGAGGRPPST